MVKNSILIIWVCGSLFVSTVGVGIYAFQQSLKIAGMAAELASSLTELSTSKASHKSNIAKLKLDHESELVELTAKLSARQRSELMEQKAKLKARERIRRSLIAVPVVGAGLIVYFEEQDYQDWLIDNPNGSRADYACEVASYSAEVIDEIVENVVDAGQSLPESVRPDPETVKEWLKVPKC